MIFNTKICLELAWHWLLIIDDMNADKFQKHTSSKPHCSETPESEDSCTLKRQYHEFFTSGYDMGK
jgi:hypothetical protein